MESNYNEFHSLGLYLYKATTLADIHLFSYQVRVIISQATSFLHVGASFPGNGTDALRHLANFTVNIDKWSLKLCVRTMWWYQYVY